jgi:hypothetical protein
MCTTMVELSPDTSRTLSEEALASSLLGDLRGLLKRGSSTASDLVFEAPDTLTALQNAGLGDDRLGVAEVVASTLDQALAQLSPEQGAALRIMLGRDERTQGMRLGERRERAARATGVKATTFRSHQERSMLDLLAQRLAVELLRARQPMSRLPIEEGQWYRWTPESSRAPTQADVARAIEQFEGPDTPWGREAASWLKTEALAAHPASVTYVCLADGRIQGFFAIKGGVVSLSQRHGRDALGALPGAPVRPELGASLVDWIARHRDADPFTESVLLRYAISIALNVAKLQGNAVFALDAHDEEQANSMIERYGFRRATGSRTRIWIPLHPV